MSACVVHPAQGFGLVGCSANAAPSSPAWPDLPEHVGVWLDRCYLGDTQSEKPCRRELYDRAIKALRPRQPAVEAYARFFERWKDELCASGRPYTVVEIQASSRVLLHPASNASVTDGSVLLHHTYGVPYLPGSGLKGVARAWMRRTVDVDERAKRKAQAGTAWQTMRSDARDQALVRTLFGYIPRNGEGQSDEAGSQAGVVEFHDALWVPEAPTTGADASAWQGPLALDVVNPHHSDYYTGEGDPGDNVEPVPTHRLSITPGTRFLVVLEGATSDSQAWVDYVAYGLLAPALEAMGFGAWTSAGYGRFALPGAAAPQGNADVSPADPGEWHTMKVEYRKGTRELSATLEGPQRRVADATPPETTALLNSLSPEVRENLVGKGAKPRLQVCIKQNGNRWKIIGLKA